MKIADSVYYSIQLMKGKINMYVYVVVYTAVIYCYTALTNLDKNAHAIHISTIIFERKYIIDSPN